MNSDEGTSGKGDLFLVRQNFAVDALLISSMPFVSDIRVEQPEPGCTPPKINRERFNWSVRTEQR